MKSFKAYHNGRGASEFMKFFLFNINDTFFSDFPCPSHGLGYLKAYFDKYSDFREEVEIRILKRDIWETIEKEKPDLIGISSVTQDYTRAIDFAKRVKDSLPSVKIMLGGIHITNMPESLNRVFDIAVIGEGEVTVKELIETVYRYGMDNSRLSKVKGLAFFERDEVVLTERRELIQDLDTIPFPFRKGLEEGTYLHMMTSRGCPYKCTYCSSSKFWGWKIRYHSAEYVVNYMLSLIREYNAVHITMWDDLFAVNKRRLQKIAELMSDYRREFKNLTIGVTVRANVVDEEMCRLLKDINVTRVSMGIESGSNAVLKKMNRGAASETNRRAIDILKKYFIVNGGFILGSPGETLEDLKETYNFIMNSSLDGGGIGVAVPYPNTPWWDYAQDKGLVSKDMDFSKLNLITDLTLVKDPDLILLAEDIPKDEFLRIGRELQKHFSWLNAKSMFDKKVLTVRNILTVARHPRIFLPFVLNRLNYLIKTYLKFG